MTVEFQALLNTLIAQQAAQITEYQRLHSLIQATVERAATYGTILSVGIVAVLVWRWIND